MADIGEVIRDQRDELIAVMGALEVQELPDKLFWIHEPDSETPIDEQEAVARLFTIEVDDQFDPAGIGSNSTTTDVDRSIIRLLISIQYPDGERWRIAAKSDYWLIVRKLISDQTFPSTTCQRFVEVVEGFPTPEETSDGFLIRVPVRCIVEHT